MEQTATSTIISQLGVAGAFLVALATYLIKKELAWAAERETWVGRIETLRTSHQAEIAALRGEIKDLTQRLLEESKLLGAALAKNSDLLTRVELFLSQQGVK